MKRISALLFILFCALPLKAQKEEITKSGLGVGPFPALAYDADKGMQIGAVLMLFDYGTGENYPALDSKFYSEFSYFTKALLPLLPLRIPLQIRLHRAPCRGAQLGGRHLRKLL